MCPYTRVCNLCPLLSLFYTFITVTLYLIGVVLLINIYGNFFPHKHAIFWFVKKFRGIKRL